MSLNTNMSWSKISVLGLKGFVIIVLLILSHRVAKADAGEAMGLVIKDHKFIPSELHIPAQQATQIQIDNQDATAEEFDSTTLGVEKVIIGSHKGTVRIHPLPPGRYPFIGEYHADTAQGVVIVE